MSAITISNIVNYIERLRDENPEYLFSLEISPRDEEHPENGEMVNVGCSNLNDAFCFAAIVPADDGAVAFASIDHRLNWAIDEGLNESEAFSESLDVIFGLEEIGKFLTGKPYRNARQVLLDERAGKK